MVLDMEVCAAAIEGDVDAVKAWFDADPSRDMNDFAQFPGSDLRFTLLAVVVHAEASDAQLATIRWLIAHGADPTVYDPGSLTPLYIATACNNLGEHTLAMVSTLLEAAPLSRQISAGMTHLRSPIMNGFNLNEENNSGPSESTVVEVIRMLLRAGAPLDDYANYSGEGRRFLADAALRLGATKSPALAQNEAFIEAKAMIDGVRACGGRWTSYCRLPHKEVLRLRSLVSRGRALPVRTQRRRPRGRDGRQDGVVTFLCKLGDNGVVWKILEFWQATR